MFAGLAPLHAERLQARGGPRVELADPNTFYECSSYGPDLWEALESQVGASQLLFGSDRPMARPEFVLGEGLPWWQVVENTRRALGGPLPAAPPRRARERRHPQPREAERQPRGGLVPAP